jgi:dephospho-CoA kinase
VASPSRLPGILRVALTGGIATGKSHCLARFAALGAPVIDADQVAREVVAPGTPGLANVVRRFGPSVLLADGRLDRAAVARIVFADPIARADLAVMLHPAIQAIITDWFDTLPERAPGARFAIADIPLLFETGRQGEFDRVIVAACPPSLQIERLTARDGLAKADAELRLGAQRPIEEKRRLADFVIDTSGTFAETDRQIADVWEKLDRAARA